MMGHFTWMMGTLHLLMMGHLDVTPLGFLDDDMAPFDETSHLLEA
jgi:hypothetical protein